MQHTGRILRGMFLCQMQPMTSTVWRPAADIYETEYHICVHVDLAGVSGESLQVMIDGANLHISGVRNLPVHASVACIHQLEIEMGEFRRTIPLPSAVEVDQVQSSYNSGLLTITLPKKQQGKVSIRINAGE